MSVPEIEAWLTADGPQVPLLVSTDQNNLDELVTENTLRDVEIVALASEGKITIKQVRELLSSIGLTTTHDRRLIFIPDAQRLQTAAANTLLKTLEESSARNRFLLTSAYPGRLLATIRSRCRIVRLPRRRLESTGSVPTFSPKRKTVLTADEVAAIVAMLQTHLRAGEGNPAVQRSLARVRDFAKAQAQGAGEKLASDALLASLVELEK